MDVITSQDIDKQYAAVCSQLGQTYARFREAADHVAQIEAELDALVNLRTRLAAQYQMATHNEAVSGGMGAPVGVHVPTAPSGLRPVKGDLRGE